MQAIRQLDQDDADIVTHGHQHLAEIVGLGLRLGTELDLGQFADAVHQFRDALSEAAPQFLFRRLGVLDHVMQYGGDQGLVVHVHVRQYAGHCQGVMDIGFAAHAVLSFVGLGAEFIGAAYAIHLVRRQITAGQLLQFGYGGRGHELIVTQRQYSCSGVSVNIDRLAVAGRDGEAGAIRGSGIPGLHFLRRKWDCPVFQHCRW